MFTGMLLTAWILIGQPAETANDQLKQEVDRLVHQLDSPQLAQRNAAEAALIQKGAAVLDLLPADDQRLSAEVQERLKRIRQKLQQLAVASALKPALITLSGENLPLSKILAALEEQSSNKIVDYRQQFGQPTTDPPLKVNFDNTPFWQALDQVLDQAEMRVYHYADQPGLNLVGRPESEWGLHHPQNAVYSGPFRFEPIRLVVQNDLRDPKASSLRLSVEAAWEPRLKPICLLYRPADAQAVDDRGQPLVVHSANAEMEVPVENLKSAVELTLLFALPPREVKEIARVKGKLTAVIAGKIEEFRFGDLLNSKNVEKRTAGVTVTLERARQDDNAWKVFVRVRFDTPGDALASHRGWIFLNEAYLEAPDGKHIAFDALETTRQTKNEVGLTYSFLLDKPPTDMKFVYKTPGAILTTAIEYEFHNLKLP